jgi:hypothetical protein
MGTLSKMEQLARLAEAGRSPEGPLPGFVIIGAMKCGTTTLDRYLRRHSGIFLSTPKEPCYFADERWYRYGEAFYRSLFAEAGPGQLCGEASTPYTRREHGMEVPRRMHELIPDAKLIYILRHPVDRTYSHHRHYMKKKDRPITFEETLEQSDEYIDAGMYLKHAERFLEYYPRDSLLVLLFEDLKREPAEVLERVQRFLGLEEEDLLESGPIHANKAGPDRALRHQTVHKIEKMPVLGGLVRVTPRPIKSVAYGLVKKSPYARRVSERSKVPPMLPETRAKLLEVYAEPNRRLAEFLGRDLHEWQE